MGRLGPALVALASMGLLFAGCSSTGTTGTRDAGDARAEAGAPDVPAPDTGIVDVEAVDVGAGDDAAADTGATDDIADAGSASCPDPVTCDAPPPAYEPVTSWRHPIATRFTISQGDPHHRGRDLILREGDPQWALAKFTYGWADDDLEDEDVDVYLLRDCRTWERLATVRTTDDGTHPTVEGVDDSGGRVFYAIPAARRLGVGRHHLHFVVRGDHTTADAFVDVVPSGTRFVVSDVDGTLTEDENAEVRALFGGASPMANPGASETLWTLARRGYHVFYLTARPEWLAPRTHHWLRDRGFPPGIVHTTLGLTRTMGSGAQTFKTEELRAFRARFGYMPDYAFGNTTTDVGAYSDTGIDPMHAYYYLLMGDLRGGQYNGDYRLLVAPFATLPRVCR